MTSFTYRPGAKVEVPLVLIHIGDIAFAGLQPELAASIGAKLRARSPYPHTIAATMINGAARYLPDAQSYDRFTYEARNSPYAKGSAETTADAIIGALKQMHES